MWPGLLHVPAAGKLTGKSANPRKVHGTFRCNARAGESMNCLSLVSATNTLRVKKKVLVNYGK